MTVSAFFSHPITAVVILLGLLVFVHEYGHFIVGRLSGIAVETFSIGFGPRLLGWRSKGTDFRISWIPLGGYVKFAGSHPSEEIPPGLNGKPFRDATLTQRAATIAAGPVANFLLAITVYATLGMVGIPHPPPYIGEVIAGSPAAAAGIQFGDRFVRIDGQKIETWRDLEEIISKSPEKALQDVLLRDGAETTVTLTPSAVETEDLAGRPVKIGRAGVALGSLPTVVTVTKEAGAAATAGLATGDQISKVSWQGPSGPVEKATRFYPELVRALEAAVKDGATSATLAAAPIEYPKATPVDGAKPQVTAATEGDGKDKAKAEPRTLTMSLAAGAGLAGKELVAALGMTDSQLTVGDAIETAAGVLKPGDRLLAFGGKDVADVYALREALIANTAAEVTVKIQRRFKVFDAPLNLKGIEVQKPEGPATFYTLPIVFLGQQVDQDPIVERYANPLAAIAFGARETGRQTVELMGNISDLISGDIPVRALGGPMLIAKVAGDSARRGWQTFLASMALISVNLGLLNLFPIPVLDGGQLVLMGAEAVRRRPLREAAIENFQKIGFAMVLALVVLATYNDLRRFWRSMLESVAGLFQ
jgi:regulator of sigma E protease